MSSDPSLGEIGGIAFLIFLAFLVVLGLCTWLIYILPGDVTRNDN